MRVQLKIIRATLVCAKMVHPGVWFEMILIKNYELVL